MTSFVHSFSAPGTPDRDQLGGKGAELARMVQLGLPVPPGFTITTAACRHVFEHGTRPAGLTGDIEHHLALLEEETGRRLGDGEQPLLVSVRSGAASSMPGMMDTVLDIGLNDETVAALARVTGDDRFAWDCYRRLVQMFGETVLGVPAERFGELVAAVVAEHGAEDLAGVGADGLRDLVERGDALCREVAGRSLPQDPREQLDLAIDAVFASWHGERARLYRSRFGIPDHLGTAVNVQAMVFGNRGAASGSGVAFTRDPATGDLGDYGEYLPDAQGEDVVSGTRTAVPMARLRELDRPTYHQLRAIMGTLERHYRDLCDIEFTVEDGRLWILQTRVGKRSPAAAFRIAADLVEEGMITEDEALVRVSGEQLTQLMFPQLDAGSAGPPAAAGLAASPGAAAGRVVLDNATAVAMAARGEDVVLVRPETRADDLPGMVAARAVVTARGGRTSHAAVVARGMGLPAVCGIEGLEIDLTTRQVTLAGRPVFAEGDVVSVDGGTGRVYCGHHRTVPAEVTRWLEGENVESPLVSAVARLLAHADRTRRVGVRANAETGHDVERAVRFGAEGVGLVRTEHMFLGDRRTYVERVLIGSDAEREDALRELHALQRESFAVLLAAAGGRPVTIRLLDAPFHEFLPDLTELAVCAATAQVRGNPNQALEDRLAAVRRHHEENPMTGLRGVRLSILRPELVVAQASAAFEAAADLRDRGCPCDLELMVPLVSSAQELAVVARSVAQAADDVAARRGRVPYRLGTMVETPRAAVTAGPLAQRADFLSFGTNDLTQLTWGLSRDDAERSFLPRYLDDGVLRSSPFTTIDEEGVGRLVGLAVDEARASRPGIPVGVCGEHAGDPASIGFLAGLGVSYLSCSPFRVPVARLEAGRAAVLAEGCPADRFDELAAPIPATAG
ncbi:pyruvate, phosphate dikinase [Nocardioides daeguensis]|uniref:Pyruvate, phosphate dikinase n=1 Tax=Nocardioides daeguensis TaxID=908359 RepID=A0ABP6UTK2_9ACTN|nr:pyruvate, phosphate dikinase [Nocardioides daeguensis]MBV6728317.1 pyruvate, phosphate dikinase [Nocardioides daeguensis]MCR1773126.1 pyruvate, phosphate dikinase [Nocardioides daeguensis]